MTRAHVSMTARMVVLSLVALAGAVPAALGEVVVAKKAKFTGRVTVQNKAPGTYMIWQSSAVGGGEYVNTGFPVTVGANGSGSVSIPNTSSGTLLVGHNVKMGNDNGPSDQAAVPVIKARGWLWDPWFASVTPGQNDAALCTISQAVHGQDGVLVERWLPGTMFALSVNPNEARFVNHGCQVQGQGDLQVEIVQLTLHSVMFRVVADPTMNTLDDVIISGLGLEVLAPVGGSVGMYLSYNGCTELYTDGNFEEMICGGGTYEYERLNVRPPSTSCKPDVNCDGAANGVDVEVQELAVGGELADYCQPDADFNGDGAVNGLDVEAVEIAVGGGPCP